MNYEHDKTHQFTQNTYILYKIGGIACFLPHTLALYFGLFCLLFGIIMASFLKAVQHGRVYQDHGKYLSGLFWRANLIVVPIVACLNFALVYNFTNAAEVIGQAVNGAYGIDFNAMKAAAASFKSQNFVTLLIIDCFSYGLALIWWLMKCGHGTRSLAVEVSPA